MIIDILGQRTIYSAVFCRLLWDLCTSRAAGLVGLRARRASALAGCRPCGLWALQAAGLVAVELAAFGLCGLQDLWAMGLASRGPCGQQCLSALGPMGCGPCGLQALLNPFCLGGLFTYLLEESLRTTHSYPNLLCVLCGLTCR